MAMRSWTVTLSYEYQIDDAPNGETALEMARELAADYFRSVPSGSVIDVRVSEAFTGQKLRESLTRQLRIH